MGCGCKKKQQVSEPVIDELPIPQTPDQQHIQEMDKYAKEIAEQTIKLFDNPEEDDE